MTIAKPATETAASLRALGKAVGKSHTAMANAAAREDWPWPSPQYGWGGKPYPVAAVAGWISRNLDQQDREPGDPETDLGKTLDQLPLKIREQVKLVMAKRQAQELANTLAVGGMVKIEDVKELNAEQIGTVKGRMQNLRLISVRLVGQSAAKIESILEDWARETCNEFEHSPAFA